MLSNRICSYHLLLVLLLAVLIPSCSASRHVQSQSSYIEQTDITSTSLLQQSTTHLEQSDYNLSVVTIIERYDVDTATGTTYLAERTTQKVQAESKQQVADSTFTQQADSIHQSSSIQLDQSKVIDAEATAIQPSSKLLFIVLLLAVSGMFCTYYFKK